MLAPKGKCGRCGGDREPYKDCLPCRRERERARYESDPEYRAKRIANATRYARANPEKVAERMRSRWANNDDVRERDRAYRLTRYAAWRARWTAELGGVCVQCGSVEDLHFDHIEWGTKSFNISKFWASADEVMAPEMAKCQLLCPPCHYAKSVTDRAEMRLRADRPS